MTERKKALRYAGIALCLALLLGGGAGIRIYRAGNAVDSMVALDVNPSVEIQVNQRERVLRVIPVNKDGWDIIGDMDFSGSDVKVAVNALIGSMLQKGYLSEISNSILISVESSDPVRGAALQDKLTAEVEKLLQSGMFSGAILSQTVSSDSELRRLSEVYGITTGKARLIQTLLEKDPAHSFADLAGLSINELNLLLSADAADAARVETVGDASDRAYIGREAALAAALEHAGVRSGEAERRVIEMDADDGRMVYELEFHAGGYKYEYEVDAVSGSIVKFEKERADSYVPAPAGGGSGGAGASAAAAGGDIGEARAKEIALSHAGVSADSVAGHCKIELDHDHHDSRHGNGEVCPVYEVEFRAGGYEYEYKIDAATGAVLDFEWELDD